MRVVHLVKNDTKGGAPKGAIRLHESLLSIGIESVVLVDVKFSHTDSVISITGPIPRLLRRFLPIIENWVLRLFLDMKLSLFSSIGLRRSDTLRNLIRLRPSIIHVHWSHGMMVNVLDVLNLGVPIVWTLHDSWLFTGGCHLPHNCPELSAGCNDCPLAKNGLGKNYIRRIWDAKYQVLSKNPITIIALSKWMHGKASASTLILGSSILTLPNPLNTFKFAPTNQCKSIKNRICFGFGAMGALTDRNKGFDLLRGAFDLIKSIDLSRLELVIYGNNGEVLGLRRELDVRSYGYISSDEEMVNHFSSVDFTIVPSRLENLSYTILESLSCGVPVICFDVGGNGNLVKDGVNGFIIKEVTSEALADCIVLCAHMSGIQINMLRSHSRALVEWEYSYSKVARDYDRVYKSMLNSVISDV